MRLVQTPSTRRSMKKHQKSSRLSRRKTTRRWDCSVFRFSREGEKASSFTVGPINKSLADRFELALQQEALASCRRPAAAAVGLPAHWSIAKSSQKLRRVLRPVVVENAEGFILDAMQTGLLKPAKGRSLNF